MYGDKEQMSVVLENILDNQIRYAENLIKISLRKDNGANKDTLILKFWNDGPEINSEIIDNIFEKFKKGEDGKHGLGLAIVRKIVNMHNGEIWAENEDDGVSFYIKFFISSP